ncbi:MAG: TRAP transporter substrate-binding protein [Janthinobacterium lividum]
MSYLRCFPIAAALCCLLTMPVARADTVLRIGTLVSPASLQAKAVDQFAQTVNQAGVGLQIKIFHAGQLGSGESEAQNIKLGIQDAMIEDPDFLTSFSKDLRLDSVPFTFSSQEQYTKWLKSPTFAQIQKDLIANGGQRFITGNVLWRRGPFRVLMGRKPVTSLADLAQTKLRIFDNEPIIRFWGSKCLGANTINLPWGDVYVALRQGAVDAVPVAFDMAISQKLVEVAPYLMITNDSWQVLGLDINERRWQSLTDAQRAAILQAMDTAGTAFNTAVDGSVAAWKTQFTAQGGHIVPFDRGPFVARVSQCNAEFEKDGYWPPGLIGNLEKLR